MEDYFIHIRHCWWYIDSSFSSESEGGDCIRGIVEVRGQGDLIVPGPRGGRKAEVGVLESLVELFPFLIQVLRYGSEGKYALDKGNP